MMRILLTLMTLLLFICLQDVQAQEKKSRSEFCVMGYLPEYRAAQFNPEILAPLTDLIIFSAEPSKEGDLDLTRLKNIPWTVFRKYKTNHRVRMILCIGGWERSENFAEIAASVEKRKRFAKSALETCLQQRLDGIDLDWEHPENAEQQKNYATLLAELKRELEPHGILTSVTMAAWQQLPEEAFKTVDRIQVMAYDHQGKHSTYENACKDVETLFKAGAPKNKIVMGLPFYARGVKNNIQTLTYSEIEQKFPQDINKDLVDDFYFNGPLTLRKKTSYALDQQLQGVMVWELGQDSTGEKSLLHSINQEVNQHKK